MVTLTSKLLVILGPTSTGKTDLALNLAKKFNGELISCDSRQVYIGLDIGTGKLPSGKWKVEDGRWKKEKGFWWLDGIKIWMYDVVDPKKQYTVYHYVKDAGRVIEEIRKRGKLPIIVGGTGFYLKALLEGLPNLTIPLDLNLRQELEKLSLQKLQRRLQEASYGRWKKMNESDRRNPRRLIRAIEIVILSETKDIVPELDSSLVAQNDKRWDRNGTLRIGLTAPRQILYQRIDDRVVSRIDQGMIEEAESLHEQGLSSKRMRQLGLEYGVLADYLEGRIKGRDELIKVLQGKIHGYARRQITWFKNPSTRSGCIYWFDVTDHHYLTKVENLVAKWYYQANDTKGRRFS